MKFFDRRISIVSYRPHSKQEYVGGLMGFIRYLRLIVQHTFLQLCQKLHVDWLNLGGTQCKITTWVFSLYSHVWAVNYTRIPLAPMGVLAPMSAHARPSARPPIDTSGNVSPQVSAESPSNISPNPSEVISEVSEP